VIAAFMEQAYATRSLSWQGFGLFRPGSCRAPPSGRSGCLGHTSFLPSRCAISSAPQRVRLEGAVDHSGFLSARRIAVGTAWTRAERLPASTTNYAVTTDVCRLWLTPVLRALSSAALTIST